MDDMHTYTARQQFSDEDLMRVDNHQSVLESLLRPHAMASPPEREQWLDRLSSLKAEQYAVQSAGEIQRFLSEIVAVIETLEVAPSTQLFDLLSELSRLDTATADHCINPQQRCKAVASSCLNLR